MSNHEESSEASEVKNKYLHALIERIVERDPDIDKKDIYKKLVKKCNFYFNECESMKEDPLWQKIVEKADEYAGEHEDTGCSGKASFECALREHKPLLMEMIENVLNEEEGEDEEDGEDEDESMDDADTVENNIPQYDIPQYKNILDRRCV